MNFRYVTTTFAQGSCNSACVQIRSQTTQGTADAGAEATMNITMQKVLVSPETVEQMLQVGQLGGLVDADAASATAAC